MMMHPSYEELNDYADGLLDAERASDIRAHVGACGECASNIAELEDLKNDARSLAHSLTPPPDVWQTIRAATINNAKAQRTRVLWQLRYQLAAAAVVLLVAASTVTWWVAQRQRPQVIVRTAPAAAENVNLVAYKEVEEEYGKAAGELLKLLAQRRSSMDTAVVRSVEENLRVMDEAIRNARAALMSDPANQDIAGILTATQESKIRMLRRAVGGT